MRLCRDGYLHGGQLHGHMHTLSYQRRDVVTVTLDYLMRILVHVPADDVLAIRDIALKGSCS